MADLTPRDLEELILAYEELDEAERNLVDRRLQDHPDLATRLEQARALEQAATDDLTAADEAWDESHLSPQEQQQQRDSLQRILAALGEPAKSSGGAPAPTAPVAGRIRRHRRRWLAWALPVAAAVIWGVVMPRLGSDPSLISDLAVMRLEAAAPDTRSAPTPGAADVLRTGDAFSLSFRLARDAFVAVYHVDPAGRVALVFAPRADGQPRPLAGRRTHRIPTAESGETWVLGNETGTETFVVAVFGGLPSGLEEVTATAAGSDPAAVTAGLTAGLARLTDQVEVIRFTHAD